MSVHVQNVLEKNLQHFLEHLPVNFLQNTFLEIFTTFTSLHISNSWTSNCIIRKTVLNSKKTAVNYGHITISIVMSGF